MSAPPRSIRVGVHLPNRTMQASDWEGLRAIRPEVVTAMARHVTSADYARLEEINPDTFYLVRLDNMTTGGAISAWGDLPQAVRDCGRAFIRVGNEPNVEGVSAEVYNERFLAIRKAWPWMPLMLANLALTEGWQDYLRALQPAIDASNAIGLSLYRDDASDPMRWLQVYRERCGQRSLWAVECNVDYEREERRTRWFDWVWPILQDKQVHGLTAFIYRGVSHGAWWDGWVLSPAEEAGLAGIIAMGRQQAAEAPVVDWGQMEVIDLRARYQFRPGTSYPLRDPAVIDSVIVHHSAARSPAEDGTNGPTVAMVDSIHAWHQAYNGWPAIAYHACVDASGTVVLTNGIEVEGWHSGPGNARGVGVCLLGDYSGATPPEAQLRGLANYIRTLEGELKRRLAIRGHKDVMASACPGGWWGPAAAQRIRDLVYKQPDPPLTWRLRPEHVTLLTPALDEVYRADPESRQHIVAFKRGVRWPGEAV